MILQVAEDLKAMDADLFRPDRMGLTLVRIAPHSRIAALTASHTARKAAR